MECHWLSSPSHAHQHALVSSLPRSPAGGRLWAEQDCRGQRGRDQLLGRAQPAVRALQCVHVRSIPRTASLAGRTQ